MNTVDTDNDFMVGRRGADIVVLIPVHGPIPQDRALRLAAWIVALSDIKEGEFDEILEVVRNT